MIQVTVEKKVSDVELVNDARAAEVLIVYLLNLRRAVLVDKRRRGTAGPFVSSFPQQELLLEGRALESPLTPQIVHLIERRQVLPADQAMMQSYLSQLLDALAARFMILRPALPEVKRLSIGPHFGPVIALAMSDIWRGVLYELSQNNERDALAQARATMRNLYAIEVLAAERRDPDELELLRQDGPNGALYRAIEL